MKKAFSLCLFIVLFFLSYHGFSFADEPEGYYRNAEQKSRYALKEALFGIISAHKELSYAEVWTAYESTDADAQGNIFDMYNDCDFKYKEDQCGSGSSGDAQNQCKCYNREHSMPKSWFAEGKPMYTDLFHLYPVSGYVNSRRSNYPFGEVSNPTYTSTSGSKLGPCIYPGYTKTVFEPVDEYKGDFARTYFYMATCYHDRISTWKSDMLAGNNQDVFTSWSKEMLLEWHLNDPVSEKETERNEAVYQIQGNRNPFIDHPEMVEKIWGDDQNPWPDSQEPDPNPDTLGIQNPFDAFYSLSVQQRFLQIECLQGNFDSVEIFDAGGKRICASFTRQNRFGYTLPSAGMYILRVCKGKRQLTKKVAVL